MQRIVVSETINRFRNGYLSKHRSSLSWRPCTVEDSLLLIDAEPALRASLHRPPEGAVQALVLHLHGGAFTAGVPQACASVADLIADAGAVVVSLDYPLAPEHPFPQPAEAAYAALNWLARQRRRLRRRQRAAGGGRRGSRRQPGRRGRDDGARPRRPGAGRRDPALAHAGRVRGHRLAAARQRRPGGLPMGGRVAPVPAARVRREPPVCRAGRLGAAGRPARRPCC